MTPRQGSLGISHSAFQRVLKLVSILAIALLAIAAKPVPNQATALVKEKYLSPIETAFSADGRLLYVVCQDSDEIRILDTGSDVVLGAIHVGHVPRGIALSPDGQKLYVTNAWSDTVSVIDLASRVVVQTLTTGFEPTGVVVDHPGETLYVANRLSSDVSVIDLATGREMKRLLAGRGASYLAMSPDGKKIYCTHIYPNPGSFRSKPESEITIIDTSTRKVVDRKPLQNVAGVFHVAPSADGKLLAVAQLRPKNLVPLAHVEHGAVFGDSLTIFGEDLGQSVQVPIDELDRYYALPWGIVITPDKSKIYVSTAGSESVTAIDISKLLKTIRTLR